MQRYGSMLVKVLEICPNAEPKESDIDRLDMRETVESTGANMFVRPFGEGAINIILNANGKKSGLQLNRTIIDGNGEHQTDIYGVFYISWRDHTPTPDEIAMYKRLFSLEECAKPIEERIKTIKEYFPNGVEGVVMPDPNNIPEADRKYITTASDTPSYTRTSPPKQTYVPHCPICGSPDIEKITLAQKAFGGIMFGLFSKTAKSQFKCNNCGAKF